MKVIILIFLILISSCKKSNKEPEIISSGEIISELLINNTDYVILPFQEDWHWIFKNVEQTELTQLELNEIERILKIAIKENNERQKINLENHNKEYPKYKWKETRFELKLSGYKRQYVPVINEKGEKEIWVNFFCNDWESDKWKKEIMIVHDGGNCYFNLKINLRTKKYSDLRINGYA